MIRLPRALAHDSRASKLWKRNVDATPRPGVHRSRQRQTDTTVGATACSCEQRLYIVGRCDCERRPDPFDRGCQLRTVKGLQRARIRSCAIGESSDHHFAVVWIGMRARAPRGPSCFGPHGYFPPSPFGSCNLSQSSRHRVEEFVHREAARHHAGAGDIIDRGFQIAPVRFQSKWRVLRIAGGAGAAL